MQSVQDQAGLTEKATTVYHTVWHTVYHTVCHTLPPGGQPYGQTRKKPHALAWSLLLEDKIIRDKTYDSTEPT